MPPPITIAATISGKEAISCTTSVVTMAMVIPTMPVRLPRRLLSGLERPLSARMKQTPEIRYARSTQAGTTVMTSVCIRLALPLLVHREHALGDGEASEDVH